MKHKIQRRAFVLKDIELRANGEDESKGKTLAGYAALFDTPSQDLGGFIEVIRRGAFAKTIQESDVRALKNHNDDYVLGRNKSSTLRLFEDDRGLRFEIDTPNAQWARDLLESIERGDVDQMSFQFRTIKDAWTRGEDGEPDLRELLEVRLYDVSPVTFPAYEETDVSVRELRARGDVDLTDEDSKTERTKDPAEPPLAGHSAEVRKRRLELALRI